MKTLSKAICLGFLVLLAPAIASAQGNANKQGFIRLVNAVAAGVGPLDLKVEGESISPDGFKLGDVTNGVPLSPGEHSITISREGTKPGVTKVKVGIDEVTILIPFAEKVPASDTEPAHWAIRVLRLKQLEPQSERSATFVSVSQQPEIKIEMRDPEGNWSSVFVKRLAVAQAPIKYPRGYVPLKMGEEKLESIPVGEPGNYAVILYDDDQGKTQALNFRDQKYLSAD